MYAVGSYLGCFVLRLSLFRKIAPLAPHIAVPICLTLSKSIYLGNSRRHPIIAHDPRNLSELREQSFGVCDISAALRSSCHISAQHWCLSMRRSMKMLFATKTTAVVIRLPSLMSRNMDTETTLNMDHISR
jgi:hypothetical protein